MRMLMKVQFPVEAGNQAFKDGRLTKVLGEAMERLKPEAAYFTAVEGHRGGFIIFDLKNTSDIPWVCEPFFMELNAKIELMPVMDVRDVQEGVARASG